VLGLRWLRDRTTCDALARDIGILIPVEQPTNGGELDVNTRTRNATQRSLRERGFALLTGRWRAL
jgi:hypothetical protein